MAKKKNKRKKKLTPASIRADHKRKDMKEAGAYDGRFSPKTFKDKSKYSRKNKNKGKDNRDEDV